MSVPKVDLARWGAVLAYLWVAAVIAFRGIAPLDPAVTGLFYRGAGGFDVISNPLWEWLRQRIWDLAILTFLVALVCWPLAGWQGRKVLGLPARIWGFVAGLFLLAPILIVNGILKAHSGRARPAQVDWFGGSHHFSLAGTFTDQCTRNCSFVSGEVSAAVALGVVIWLGAELARPRLAGWVWRYLRVIGVAVPVFIALQRIVTGRHFLSDTVFAALVTLSVAWLLWGLIFGGWVTRLRRWPRPPRKS